MALEYCRNQQRSGTLNSAIPVDTVEKDEKNKLTRICADFLNVAASYEFTVDDIVGELNRKSRATQ